MKRITKGIITISILAAALILTSCEVMSWWGQSIILPWPNKDSGTSEKDAETSIKTSQDWLDAVNAIKNGGNNRSYTLNISGNITVPGGTNPTFGSVTDLNVTLAGTGSLTLAGTGNLVQVGANQTVTVGNGTNGPALIGNNSNDKALVLVNNNAFLVLQNGAIKGNKGGYGGGVGVEGGGTFTMSGGTISGNSASGYGYGGGVYVGQSATFNMSGGTISGNTSPNSGGGVGIAYGTFNMTGGTISGNTAADGGGVYAETNYFTKSGSSSIVNNSANGNGQQVRAISGGNKYRNAGAGPGVDLDSSSGTNGTDPWI